MLRCIPNRMIVWFADMFLICVVDGNCNIKCFNNNIRTTANNETAWRIFNYQVSLHLSKHKYID